MISVIKTAAGLSEKQGFIDSLFGNFGEIYLQEYRSLMADFSSKKSGDYRVFLDEEKKLASAFEKKSQKTWQCTILGFPVLCPMGTGQSTLSTFFYEIQKDLEVTTLYFPLVYGNCKIFYHLKEISGPNCWERLPSPVVMGDLSPMVIWNRVLNRYGSRANRQKKKFENNLKVKRVKKEDVESIIEKVELNSWKRQYSQDMLSRGNQFAYYTEIIKSGLADITVAFDKDDQPVAFRVDSLVNGVLYIIKWSYDENYKQYSPGFYLLTVETFKKYQKANLRFIDLYGSPDMLKNQIETDRLDRFDLCYSTDEAEVEIIRAERTTFDSKISNNYQNQQSIKRIFNF